MMPACRLFTIVAALMALAPGGLGRLSAQSLIAHLEFEGDTTDSSGSGTDGVLTVGSLGGSAYVDGPVGQALRLDHDPATITSDKTEGAYVALSLTLPAQGSIAFWYRLTDLYNYQSLFDNSGEANDWEMWIYSDGVVRGRIDGEVGQTSHRLTTANSWIHVAYTWERGGSARLWIDGVERDTGSGLRAISEAGFDGAVLGDTVYIGGGSSGNTYANGAFDDFRIYDGAIDETTVQSLVSAGTPPVVVTPDSPASLLLHWELEGDVTDASGAGRDGELIIGAQGGAAYEPGPVGQALKLDHAAETLTSDKTEGAYVRVPLTLPEEGSLAFWYRTAPYYNYQSLFDNSANADDWEMWIYADGVVRGRVDGNVGQVSHGLGPALEWHHIAYSWRRGGQARLWVDGEEQDTGSAIRLISERQYDAVPPGDTFYLGGGNDGNTYAIGAFDDVRLYEGTLTGAEVLALFEAGDPPEPTEVEPNLLLRWELDGNLADSSGNGLDGSLAVGALGSANYTEGARGAGLHLQHDAATLTSDKTEGAAVSAPLELGEKGTIALWYRVAPYYNYQSVWDNSVEANDWEMWVYSDGRLRARIDGGSGDITTDLDDFQGPDAWYHIAYAWDREAGFAALFVNGEEVGSGAITGWVPPGDTLYFGGGNDGNTFGAGIFDEVRVYDRALSADRVRSIMTEGALPPVWLPLDGDLTNHGTLGPDYDGIGSSGANGTYEFVTSRLGGALSLENDPDTAVDGASVAVPDPLGDTGTIAFWYRVAPYYNYQSVFDNSVEANDWEMWVYSDGRLRVRIDGGSGEITKDLDELRGPEEWYHIVYAWDREEATASLWIDGESVGTATIGTWIEPGAEFYLGGGSSGNDYSNGVFDDVRIYDRVITDLEVSDLAARSPVCVDEPGDTHLTGLEVTGPEGGGPGLHTIAASAVDDSGDAILYSVSVTPEGGETILLGPSYDPTTVVVLGPGTYEIGCSVDDDGCADEAEDASGSVGVEVSEGASVGPFVRGDCNGNGVVDGGVTEAVFLLEFFYRGATAPPCLAACDVDGDGELHGVTEAVYILVYQFAGGGPPVAPYPACAIGPLPTDADLGCASPAVCVP